MGRDTLSLPPLPSLAEALLPVGKLLRRQVKYIQVCTIIIQSLATIYSYTEISTTFNSPNKKINTIYGDRA